MDIKTEIRDVEERACYEVADYKGINPWVMDEKEAMMASPIHKKIYTVRKSYKNWPIRHFALTEESWEVLDELLGLRREELCKKIEGEKTLSVILTKNKIKLLPWYKRLFNKF